MKCAAAPVKLQEASKDRDCVSVEKNISNGTLLVRFSKQFT